MRQVEEKITEDLAGELLQKPSVFQFGGVTEEITDPKKTFEQLRKEKEEDFPELEDGKRVSWTMEYGKITKTIPKPKDSVIHEMKTEIEKSEGFRDMLKKAKDRDFTCKVRPHIAAQSKGIASYKCESIVEKQKGKQESKRSEQVKEQTLKRANMRGRLNPRMSLHPVKKGFNRLSATADIGAEAVSRLQNIIRPFLSWSRKFKGIHLPQFLFPCRIYIGPVGKQGPIGDRCKLQHHLLCCPEVTVRSLRDLNCTGNG